MPTLEFKGKQFVYSHHLSVPFRELKVVSEKSLPAEGQKPSLDDNLIIHGDNLGTPKPATPARMTRVSRGGLSLAFSSTSRNMSRPRLNRFRSAPAVPWKGCISLNCPSRKPHLCSVTNAAHPDATR